MCYFFNLHFLIVFFIFILFLMGLILFKTINFKNIQFFFFYKKQEIFYFKSFLIFLLVYFIFFFKINSFNLTFMFLFENFVFFNFSHILFFFFLLIFFFFILIIIRFLILNIGKLLFVNLFLFIFLFLFLFLFLISFDIFIFIILLISTNILTYALLTLNFNSKLNYEAAVKYFLSSTLSTLFIICGLILCFFFFETTCLFKIQQIILFWNSKSKVLFNLILISKFSFFFNFFNVNNFFFLKNSFFIIDFILLVFLYKFLKITLTIIIVFIFIGFFFKLSVFPFHFWASELYSVLNYIVLFFYMIFLKIVFFFNFFKVVFIFLFSFDFLNLYNFLLIFGSISSIIFGSLLGFYEIKLSKILAYSSISQIGFVLLPLISNCTYVNVIGYSISFFYFVIYILTTIVLIYILSLWNGMVIHRHFSLFSLLFSRIFFLPFILIVFVFFSFAGIPPFPGFFIKFHVLLNLWDNKFFILTIFSLVLSIFSLFFYLRVIKSLFISPLKKIYKNFNVLGFYKKEFLQFEILYSVVQKVIGKLFCKQDYLYFQSNTYLDSALNSSFFSYKFTQEWHKVYFSTFFFSTKKLLYKNLNFLKNLQFYEFLSFNYLSSPVGVYLFESFLINIFLRSSQFLFYNGFLNNSFISDFYMFFKKHIKSMWKFLSFWSIYKLKYFFYKQFFFLMSLLLRLHFLVIFLCFSFLQFFLFFSIFYYLCFFKLTIKLCCFVLFNFIC